MSATNTLFFAVTAAGLLVHLDRDSVTGFELALSIRW
jgi:hypothetical protein